MGRTELIRAALGILCFFVAGAQMMMRFKIAEYFDDQTRRRSAQKERTLSTALLLLLTGIGLFNLTHLHASLTISTLVSTIGIGYATWAIVDLWRWGQEEATNGNEDA